MTDLSVYNEKKAGVKYSCLFIASYLLKADFTLILLAQQWSLSCNFGLLVCLDSAVRHAKQRDVVGGLPQEDTGVVDISSIMTLGSEPGHSRIKA